MRSTISDMVYFISKHAKEDSENLKSNELQTISWRRNDPSFSVREVGAGKKTPLESSILTKVGKEEREPEGIPLKFFLRDCFPKKKTYNSGNRRRAGENAGLHSSKSTVKRFR